MLDDICGNSCEVTRSNRDRTVVARDPNDGRTKAVSGRAFDVTAPSAA